MTGSSSPPTPSWVRLYTRTGRYEYQFQGSGPAVRNGEYLPARDFQFLVMDDQGTLFRIPVQMTEEVLGDAALLPAADPADRPFRIAEAQLRAALDLYRPRPNVPFDELDSHFRVDAARARALASGL